MGLYNRYIPGAWPEPDASPPQQEEQPAFSEGPEFADVPTEPVFPPNSAGRRPKTGGLFGGAIKLPELDSDTILLLILVYFLVEDGSENISDTILIIGILLLLGF